MPAPKSPESPKSVTLWAVWLPSDRCMGSPSILGIFETKELARARLGDILEDDKDETRREKWQDRFFRPIQLNEVCRNYYGS